MKKKFFFDIFDFSVIFHDLGNMTFVVVRQLRNKNYRSIRPVFPKKVFLKILQNSAENTFATVSFI